MEIYKIENVEALWPKIDQTYHFNDKVKRTIPCGPREDNAEYSIEFRMNKDAAQKLHKAMSAAYGANRPKGAPDKLVIPFVKEDDGMYKHKSTIKGQYSGNLTHKPVLADSQGQRLPSDFKLTTGSTVNIYVQFIPYKMGPNSGVSLRLKGVQVIKYNEYTPLIEFDVVEGGYTMDGEDTPIDIPPVKEADSFDEEPVKEPKKAAKKTAPPPTAATDDDLSSIVDDWDD